jgi:hypothetical protein
VAASDLIFPLSLLVVGGGLFGGDPGGFLAVDPFDRPSTPVINQFYGVFEYDQIPELWKSAMSLLTVFQKQGVYPNRSKVVNDFEYFKVARRESTARVKRG